MQGCGAVGGSHVFGMVMLIALVALAVLLGGMAFFATVMAPLVFTKLPGATAGAFIREVFPAYYLFVLICAAIAAVALAAVDVRQPALAMGAVALVTLWLRHGLMPAINRASDAARAGDVAAKARFDRAHRASVVVNLAQLGVVGWALGRLAG